MPKCSSRLESRRDEETKMAAWPNETTGVKAVWSAKLQGEKAVKSRGRAWDFTRSTGQVSTWLYDVTLLMADPGFTSFWRRWYQFFFGCPTNFNLPKQSDLVTFNIVCNWASILEIDPTFGVPVSESDSPTFGVDISRLLRFKATWSNRISNMAMVSWGAHNTGRWSVRDDLFHVFFLNVFRCFSCKDGEEVQWV